jgi:hypothetical protein
MCKNYSITKIPHKSDGNITPKTAGFRIVVNMLKANISRLTIKPRGRLSDAVSLLAAQPTSLSQLLATSAAAESPIILETHKLVGYSLLSRRYGFSIEPFLNGSSV